MSNSSGIVRAAGEGVGNFLAGIPPALIDFFSGIGAARLLRPYPEAYRQRRPPPRGVLPSNTVAPTDRAICRFPNGPQAHAKRAR